MAYLNKITLYMSDTDHQLIKEKAAKAKMSMSSYVRKRCLEEEAGLINLFRRQE